MRTPDEHGRGTNASKRLGGHIRSNVVGYLALFVALTMGTAYANHLNVRSSDIVNGQVKTKDLKRGAVKGGKIKRNGVKGNKIAPNSIDSAKIADGSIAIADLGAGSVGGSQIAGGAVGSSKVADDSLTGADIDESSLGGGLVKGYVRTFSNSPETGTENSKTATAQCPAGTELLGGGGNLVNAPATGIAIAESGPGSPADASAGTWRVKAYETTVTASTWSVRAWVFCAEV